jgi:hypothetical protein
MEEKWPAGDAGGPKCVNSGAGRQARTLHGRQQSTKVCSSRAISWRLNALGQRLTG